MRNDEKAIQKLMENKRLGVFWDAGVGKTALLLSLIDERFFRNEDVKKVLVIAPKNVTLSTWQDEIHKWERFRYMKPIVELIEGTPKQREKQLDNTPEYCIHIISSSLTEWIDGKRVRRGKSIRYTNNKHRPDYDMIVVDECSQFKSYSSQRHRSLKRLIDKLDPYLYLLSGTPFPNMSYEKKFNCYKNPEELYYVLCFLEIFNGTVTDFRNQYCFQKGWDKYNYYIDKRNYIMFKKKIDKRSIKKKLVLNIKLTSHKVYCPMDKKRLKTLKKKFYIETEGLKKEKVTAQNKAVMINKSLQLSNGFVYDFETISHRINDYKFKSLKTLLSFINENVIIFYNFVEDKKYILENLPGVRTYENEQDKKDWNAGKIKYFLLSPAANKFGLNLQQGGNVIIWFGLVWNAENYIQSTRRLYRRGQKNDVEQYFLLAKDGFDDYVYERLVLKKEIIDSFVIDEDFVKQFKEVKSG